MRVLHVITRFGLGGAEQIARSLAQGQSVRSVEVGIMPAVAIRDATFAAATREALEQSRVRMFPGSRLRTAKLAVFEAAWQLHQAVVEFQPDLIHVHTEIPEFTHALASLWRADFSGRVIVRTIHNAILWGGWGVLGRFAESRLDGATVVAVSGAARQGFVRWRQRVGLRDVPVTVVYNAVPCPDGQSPRRIRSGLTQLCFAGRFEAQKGIDVLLGALELLDRSDLPFDVTIFGSGRLEATTRRRASGLRRRVAVEPPRPALSQRLRDYDAILMPSRFEGLPLLAVEALCGEVPVLATAAPGLDEALPATYPGRCKPGSVEEFAQLIEAFVRDPTPWRDAAVSARLWAAERFSMTRMLDAYAAVYDAALGIRARV